MLQRLFAPLFTLLVLAAGASAADVDALRPQRKEVYGFTEKPAVARDGDRFTITFVSKDYCDATVAIEDRSGRIIRHLASGVLGKNAPEPFQKNSLRQTIVRDGKNDPGRYVDDLGGVTVRVSLGLKPQFERTLLWSPHRRHGSMPLLAAGPEGGYVHDGRGVDFIRLFDREGNNVRSVYPFPHDKLAAVEGLNWYDYPQGYRLPRKGGLYQADRVGETRLPRGRARAGEVIGRRQSLFSLTRRSGADARRVGRDAPGWICQPTSSISEGRGAGWPRRRNGVGVAQRQEGSHCELLRLRRLCHAADGSPAGVARRL